MSKPTLTLYIPTGIHTGIASLILPGGGYELQAIKHEGHDVAKYLANQGIVGAVLKYRLPKPEFSTTPEKLPITDVKSALSLLRQKHQSYRIHPDKIGVLGFSAGGHLATAASLSSQSQYDTVNFSVLIYGVTRLNQDNINWLEKSLYHREMTVEEQSENRFLTRVNASTPPAFLVHAYDDNVCHVSESTLYAEQLKLAKVPVEMHLFEQGGHGFGMGRSTDGTDQWPALFVDWVTRQFN